ncbi:uncharacterized protein LOC127705285 isoform X3 [Mytilus californianus]|uniref:uncharacterized protein LOC127705285 isoform X3 n=1 Tax=Mytilus californianus TaxID=6549 RepID=UPI002246D2BD|nr:uncharacterized protein LOC127705285 isoform X3 [Mytilus californianus]
MITICIGILTSLLMVIMQTSSFYTDIPSAYNLEVIKEGRRLKLTWSKPEMSEDIKGYRIYCKSKSTCEEKTFPVEGADNLCFYLTKDMIKFVPCNTYRFKISACLDESRESKKSKEAKFETGITLKPQDFKSHVANGTVVLVWASPPETVFPVEGYTLEQKTEDDCKTHHLSSDTLSVTVQDLQHTVYHFKIYASSNKVLSEPVERIFSAEHAYIVEMVLSITEREHGKEVTGKVGKIIEKIFSDGCNNIPGNQRIIYSRIRDGSLLVDLTFISEGFYEEQYFTKILKSTFKSIRIGNRKFVLEDFSLQGLNNPAPPQSVHASNDDNVVTVSWNEPLTTLFKTDHFSIHVQKVDKNKLTFEESDEDVPSNQLSYTISDVLPNTSLNFTIFTCICHSIRSLPSEIVRTYVKGPTPPVNVKATIKGSTIEISWTKPLRPVLKFVEYFEIKIVENENISYDSVRSDCYEYELINCKPLTKYRFEISTYTMNDHKSEPSDSIEIQTTECITVQSQAHEKPSKGNDYIPPSSQGLTTDQFTTSKELTSAQVPVSPTDLKSPSRLPDVIDRRDIPSFSGQQDVIDRRRIHRLSEHQDCIDLFFDCVIINDMIVLTSYSNCELLIRYTDGRGNRKIRLSGKPRCMSIINDDHIAVFYIKPVALEDGQIGNIEIIDINKGLENTIADVWEVGCMTCQDGLLFVVIDGRKITAMNLSGIIVRSFSCPSGDTSNISSNETKLFLTASAKNVLYCCDLFGSVLWEFKDDSLRIPSSITVDPDHNVYVTGDRSKNVIIVSTDGKYHNDILLKDCQVTFPIIIRYDTKRNHLLAYNCVIGEAFLFGVKPSFTENCDVNLVKTIKLV